MNPDRFFIVGAQRCGTTALYNALEKHSDITMATPKRPEPKFFLDDTRFQKGVDYYNKAHFSHSSSATHWGEKSTSYIEYPLAAQRISQWFPKAKILVMVREPVMRAISNYRFTYKHGLEKHDINDAFLNESKYVSEYRPSGLSVCPFAYLQRGRYVDYLKDYLDYFPKEQIKVIVMERLIADELIFLNILRFLGLSACYADFKKPVNQSEHFEVTLFPETQSMLKSYFKDTNEELADQFNVDVSSWYTPKKAEAVIGM